MADKISGDEYYTTLAALNCTVSVEGQFNAASGNHLTEDKVFKSTGRNDFHICPDTHGTLMWESGTMDDGRPLLVLTSQQADEKYLEYLRGKGISYIAAGKESIDLVKAMEIRHEEFGVHRLAVLGGGLINGGFLSAGLIDEVSLLLASGIDGRKGW